MKKTLTPQDAKMLAGGSMTKLAHVFTPPVTRQAVHHWFVAKKIPRGRVFELMQIRPDWFA